MIGFLTFLSGIAIGFSIGITATVAVYLYNESTNDNDIGPFEP